MLKFTYRTKKGNLMTMNVDVIVGLLILVAGFFLRDAYAMALGGVIVLAERLSK